MHDPIARYLHIKDAIGDALDALGGEEVWQPVPDLPDVFASSLGRIRERGEIMRPRVYGRNGYRYPWWRYWKVARLVLLAFKGPPPDDVRTHVLHKDDNQFNNTPSNLYWGSNSDNVADAVRNGLRNGEANASAVLTETIVRAARKRYVPYCRVNGVRAMAREYGVSMEGMRRAIAGLNWKHV